MLSKSPVAKIKPDQDLVQRLFLTSVETGLASETIVTEMKPLLRNPIVSVEDPTFAGGHTCSSDQQLSVKLNKNKLRPRLNAAEIEYEAEHDLNLIPSKPDSTKDKYVCGNARFITICVKGVT